MDRRNKVEQAAAQWCKDLTDESGRNRLLYYKDQKRGTLDLTEANSSAVNQLRKGKKIQLSKLFPAQIDDSALILELEEQAANANGNNRSQNLLAEAIRGARTISRTAQKNFEEKGIDTLFLGWGMATWTAQATSATPAAPVLLCPVSLHRQGTAETDYDFELTGEWTLNEALLQHLANEFRVDVSGEDLLDPYGDGEQISPDEEQAIFAELSKRAASVPNFEITERLIVGNFMYKKMPMVNDMKEHLDALADNDLIAALAGDETALESVRSHSYEPVDNTFPDSMEPSDEFLVLSADSSQSAAVNAALAGHSFVLQGPPGTGKSQTISNLIAVMMAEGKRVLFVAEKRAAIDAVVKRLTNVGLDHFVMDLHGGVSSRKKLAQQLAASFTRITNTQSVDHQELHQHLAEARQELSGYVEALHQKRAPWGLSYFEVLSELLSIETKELVSEASPQPAIRFSSVDLQDLDETTTQQVRRDVRDWVDMRVPLASGQSPWAGAVVTSMQEARSCLNACICLSGEVQSRWQTQRDLLVEQLGIAVPGSVMGWASFMADFEDLTSAVAKSIEILGPEIFSVDLEKLAQDLAPATGNGLSLLFNKLLNKQYKLALSELERIKVGSKSRGARELLEQVENAHNLARRWGELGCSGIPRVLDKVQQAKETFQEFKDAVDTLAAVLPNKQLAGKTAEEIAELVQTLQNDQSTVLQLPTLYDIEQRLRATHIGTLLDDVIEKKLHPDDLELAFCYARLRAIQQEFLLADTRLSGFQGSRQLRYVREFQQADTKHLEDNPQRVARRIAEHAIDALNRDKNQEQLIRKEASKKTRHLPLRSLFEQAPDALAAIRPCWAMSPLDVAQTMPPLPLFDLVVFDEASQVLPCDAISAILRGRRVMVAGDSRQLPPTTFFDGSGGDDDLDEDEESMSDYESILDVMDARLSRRPLTWHYRSQDERLIAYSNQEIYHGSLTTFPGANADQRLNWEFVPHQQGVATEKGSNSAEVLRVVDLMVDHARNRPGESLGVIAMGMHHANRIEEVLRQRLMQESDPTLEDFFKEANEERAFVKNLERVQGDERDAIILSIGYGKNAAGKMQYRFGPLNQEGGERRLNVAITRARKRMTLVTSFAYSDMDPDRTKSVGANMLRGFLKFVQSGGTELDGADSAQPLNPFEVDIYDKLTAAGLDVVPQYGCSGYRIDFAVRHPTKPGYFVLAVEADGASYHSSHTARDRDRLRQEHLERLGWQFCRIWSTDWFKDHRSEVARVLQAYQQVVQGINSGLLSSVTVNASSDTHSADSDLLTSQLKNQPPSRQGPRPQIPHQVSSIDDYSQTDLVALGKWLESDGLLRTDAEMFEAMFAELPFRSRGSKITAALNAAISVMKQDN